MNEELLPIDEVAITVITSKNSSSSSGSSGSVSGSTHHRSLSFSTSKTNSSGSLVADLRHQVINEEEVLCSSSGINSGAGNSNNSGSASKVTLSNTDSPSVVAAAASTSVDSSANNSEAGANLSASALATAANANNNSSSSPRRSSLARNRRKSRKLTQVCADDSIGRDAAVPAPPSPFDALPVLDQELAPNNVYPLLPADDPLTGADDALSLDSSLMSFDSSSSSSSMSSTSSSSSSSSSAPADRKISRIFNMLQSMQHAFLQQQPSQEPLQQSLSSASSDHQSHHNHHHNHQHNNYHHHQQQQQQHPPLQQQQQQQLSVQQEPVYSKPAPMQLGEKATLADEHIEHDMLHRPPAELPADAVVGTGGGGAHVIHDEACKLNSLRRQQLQLELQDATAPPRRYIYNLGRSHDSLMSGARSVINRNNPVMQRHKRLGSVNSWAGSQCSGFTCTTATSEGPPPPLIQPMPFHKDGWTSMFIVASSTYAQLLIVICIVAALSEVVTHNVPFLYFEGFFAYLYTVSIIFFLYVFVYLLRSKRRKEAKRRLRKMSKWRASNMSTNSANSLSQEPDGGNYRLSRNASVSLENEMVTTQSPLNRFLSTFSSQRRRFSKTDSVANELGPDGLSKGSGVSQNPHPHKSLEWTGSSVSFNMVDESPSDTITYAMSGANVIHGAASSSGRSGAGKSKKMKVTDNEHSHGSFFLRAGAVAFGLGTMIYDGLEFGAFLEVPSNSPCFALLRGLNPVLHAIFVFLQMYFIFVSVRLNIHKFKAIARFGLMHCLATNVCVWVRTLVRESMKEINHHGDHHGKDHGVVDTAKDYATKASDAFLHHVAEAVAAVAGKDDSDDVSSSSLFEFVNDTLAEAVNAATAEVSHSMKEGKSLWELTGNVSCGRRIFLGDLIMDAAPFLYPFLIEYSLIGAAMLYVIWAHIGLNPKYKTNEPMSDESIWNSKSRQLRVDCVGASKGLFIGLFFLTATLLCLVLFFIFAPQPQYHRLGLFLADAAHCTLLLVSLVAMAIGAYRARHLHFHSDHMEEIGEILIRISALGIFTYCVFSMIAAALAPATSDEPPMLVLLNSMLSIVEVTVQTLFISDLSRRRVSTVDQDREKPGRQAVTFLLITNITLWLVYTFEMQKVEANPIQLNFFGFLPWAIVQRVTIPLCIFYRFHSSIIYAEIWKNTYRFRGSASHHVLPNQYTVS